MIFALKSCLYGLDLWYSDRAAGKQSLLNHAKGKLVSVALLLPQLSRASELFEDKVGTSRL